MPLPQGLVDGSGLAGDSRGVKTVLGRQSGDGEGVMGRWFAF